MKVRNLIFLSIFFLSIFLSTFIIDKYDKYEISSDNKINHQIIKADVLRFWKEAHDIKSEYENGNSLSELGNWYFSSFLPSKTIAIYYTLISEDLFIEKIEDNELLVKSENKKIGFIYIQIIIFFCSTFYFYSVLRKKIGNSAFFVFIFLLIEPTIHQFNYSFHSESIFFSITILLLSQLIKNSNHSLNGFFIGFLVGILYLQRSISIFYFIPILIYFFLEKKKIKYFISYFIGIALIIFLLGSHNYMRSGIFYFTPFQSKIDLYQYLIPNILDKKEKSTSLRDMNEMSQKIVSFKKENNIDFQNEGDRLIYGNFVRKLSIQYLIDNSLLTFQVIFKKSLHALNFNPFEIYSFYEYEYKPDDHKKRYYKSLEHQNLVKVRVFYSLIIYLVCLLGFFYMMKERKLINFQILLILSIAYYVAIGGWLGNPRYLSTNLIFLSVFFIFGLSNLKKIATKLFYKK